MADSTRAPDLEALRRRLPGIATSYRIPRDDVEDLVQDTLLLYWARRAEIDNPAAWVTAVLQRRCLMYWRDRRARREQSVEPSTLDHLAPSVPSPDHQVEARQSVRHVLRSLSDRRRRVLFLRLAAGLDSAEVAERLGYSSPSTVRKLLSQALAELREAPPPPEAHSPPAEPTGPLTARELAERTGVPRGTIRHYARLGLIPHSGSGRNRRYPPEAIDALRRVWRPRGRPRAGDERASRTARTSDRRATA